MILPSIVSKPWLAHCPHKVVGSCTFLPSVIAQFVMPLYRSEGREVRIQPPIHGAKLGNTQVKVWVVRVWEPEPPQGVEALEWILVTTVPVGSVEDAWERVKWYKWRWLLEDFHKVLKTGCRMEDRLLQTVPALWNRLGYPDANGDAFVVVAADRTASARDAGN